MIENFDNCTENVSQKEFFILDDIDNEPANLNDDNGQFKVTNNTGENLNFLKIDHCLKFDQDYQKCDCAIFNDNIFCFIELKTMTSNKATSKTKRRKKAEEQLKNTIKNFKDQNIIENKILEAYVSITCNIDGSLSPITNISNKNKILEFEEDFNTKLYYNCKKEFN